MKTHSAPNQRTHLGFVVSAPAYCKDYAERGDPTAWWWQHHSDEPFLTGMARYVRERVLVGQAERMPPTKTNITHPDD